jgi:hypothetical protein
VFKHALVCAAAALAAGCSVLADSNWMVFERGYSRDVAPYGDEFAIRVHLNQLKQLGGDVKSAEFRLFVSERLKSHGLCLGGWDEREHFAVNIHGG